AGPDPVDLSQMMTGSPRRWPAGSATSAFTGTGDPTAGSDRASLAISWVTMERLAREAVGPRGAGRSRPYRDDAQSLTDTQLLDKLRGFGIELDRAGLEALCQDALSAQEVASRLVGHHVSDAEQDSPEVDWIWLAVLALWQRWWPAKPCLETIDDKIQDGYARLEHDRGVATDRWLDAWSDVLYLCDATGLTTIAGFDERFPMTQSLFNWHQDLEMELGNAGLDDQAKLRARIAVGEEIMSRFTDCDRLVSENWRRAIAEAWFWLGETAKADQLYRDWLGDDPQWGSGWIGWASGYMPPSGKGLLTDDQRAEELLRQGYGVTGVRDRDAIAEWLRLTRDKLNHPERS
ncbi:MAG TPA: hypothetical protein VFC19_40965, partial [Candidatus Limnocylindrales bacterium]|nr:hypothetical protein [Candidatus Limnocylindrales bacterium]